MSIIVSDDSFYTFRQIDLEVEIFAQNMLKLGFSTVKKCSKCLGIYYDGSESVHNKIAHFLIAMNVPHVVIPGTEYDDDDEMEYDVPGVMFYEKFIVDFVANKDCKEWTYKWILPPEVFTGFNDSQSGEPC